VFVVHRTADLSCHKMRINHPTLASDAMAMFLELYDVERQVRLEALLPEAIKKLG
jgi:hypothetical protein